MGLSFSYSGVQRLMKNAVDVVAAEIVGRGSFGTVSFAVDNADHNILTLDGKGTFHGIGMIAALTSEQQTAYVMPRKKVSQLNAKEVSWVGIVDY